MIRRDPFQAISDPTRRAIIELLQNESLNINAIVAHLTISRPAVSKHLHILEESGLLRIEANGKERICKVQNQALQAIQDWIKSLKTKPSKEQKEKDKKSKKKKGKK